MYVLPANDVPESIRMKAGAWTGVYLDWLLRDSIRDWQGRHPCIVIDPDCLADHPEPHEVSLGLLGQEPDHRGLRYEYDPHGLLRQLHRQGF